MDDDDGAEVEATEVERIGGLEPLLGPRQAALVEALTARLGRGMPMSDADQTAFCWLAGVLRLSARPAP